MKKLPDDNIDAAKALAFKWVSELKETIRREHKAVGPGDVSVYGTDMLGGTTELRVCCGGLTLGLALIRLTPTGGAKIDYYMQDAETRCDIVTAYLKEKTK